MKLPAVLRLTALAAALATLTFSPDLRAAPTFVRLSVAGDSATQIGIAWTTLTGTAEAKVEYGEKSGAYTGNATGAVEAQISATLGYTSVVTLSGLKANTTYYYRVGGAAGGWSSEHTFKTGPPVSAQCGTYRFAYAGDSRAESWEIGRGASVKWPMISLKIASYKPHFLLHGGDIVYDGKNEQQWAHMLLVSEPATAILPMMWSIGNHDDGPGEGDGANFNRLFHLPRADKALGGSGTEDYYAFRYGNGIFVALATDTFTGGATKFAEQAAWLDKLLTANATLWKVVYLHKPIYTDYLFINHKPNEAGQNPALVPIFNKHHVDIVIGSHNHFYERFTPSACQNGASEQPCPAGGFDKGTVFLTSGGAGAFPVFLAGGVNAVRLATSGVHHFLMADVVNNRLEMQALDENGAVIDKFAITKAWTGPDPCASAPDGGTPGGDGTTPSKDGATPNTDGATAKDGASPSQDGATPGTDGATPSQDGAAARDAAKADAASTGGDSGGCSCRVGSGGGATGGGGVFVWLLVLVCFARRTRGRRGRGRRGRGR